jgi:hypothetical protein
MGDGATVLFGLVHKFSFRHSPIVFYITHHVGSFFSSRAKSKDPDGSWKARHGVRITSFGTGNLAFMDFTSAW